MTMMMMEGLVGADVFRKVGSCDFVSVISEWAQRRGWQLERTGDKHRAGGWGRIIKEKPAAWNDIPTERIED